MAYYGAGSIIIKSDKTPRLRKSTAKDIVKAEDIMENGLEAIPWIGFRLGETDAKITVIENQYITLTEGDTYYGVSVGRAKEVGGPILDNNWQQITTAKYKFAEDDAPTNLPDIDIRGIYWNARSRLDFNMGPDSAQRLHKKDSFTFYTGLGTEANPYIEAGTLAYAAGADDSKAPIAVYANHICQRAHHELYISKYLSPAFNLKIIKLEDPEIQTTSGDNEDEVTHIVNLGNYKNGDTKYTKVSFAELEATNNQELFSLNVNIPKKTYNQVKEFGLIMFYYIEDDTQTYDSTKAARLTVETDGTEGAGIRPYNIGDNFDTDYVFQRGIQVLEVSQGVTSITIYTDNYFEDSAEGILIFSELSLVKGINPKLSYQFNSSNNNTALKQLLLDITEAGVASSFYYNAPISNENAIDLNKSIESETLLSPEAWYDPNNVNNKFVVSEIDADYLTTGITLTKASRV